MPLHLRVWLVAAVPQGSAAVEWYFLWQLMTAPHNWGVGAWWINGGLRRHMGNTPVH